MAYRRMGAAEEYTFDPETIWATSGGGIAPTWNLGPLTTTGAAGPIDYVRRPTPATSSGVPPLLARPAETGESSGTPWLLLAGLGLVAYMVMR